MMQHTHIKDIFFLELKWTLYVIRNFEHYQSLHILEKLKLGCKK